MEPVDRREELVRRVAFAVRGRKGKGEPAGTNRAPAGPGEETSLAARFRERFEEQGGKYLEGPALEPMLPLLGEALRLAGVAALLYPEGDDGARAAAESLAPFGPFTIVPPAEALSPSAPVSAGIQTAECAVAETGSIVQTSAGGKTLLPGLVADAYVAILSPGALVDRIEDCLSRAADPPPRNISFISGPSRTGDIEQTITVGAHGPKSVIAVLLTNPST